MESFLNIYLITGVAIYIVYVVGGPINEVPFWEWASKMAIVIFLYPIIIYRVIRDSGN